MMDWNEIAAAGYFAYSLSTDEEMPSWDNLPEPIQKAWIAAAQAIAGLVSQ